MNFIFIFYKLFPVEGKIHFETVIFDIRKVAKKIHKQNLTITKKLMKSFYGRMKTNKTKK